MSPKPTSKIEEIEKSDPRAPRIILRTLPSLSFSTPTHTVRIQLSVRQPPREKAPINRRNRASLGTPRPAPRAVPDINGLSAHRPTAPTSEQLEQLGKARVLLDAALQLEKKLDIIARNLTRAQASFELLPDMLQRVLAGIDTHALIEDSSPPSSASGDLVPPPSLAFVAALATPPTPCAEFLALEAQMKVVKTALEEIAAAMAQLEADAEVMKADYASIWTRIRESRMEITSIQVMLSAIERKLPLLAAARAIAPAERT